MNNIYITISLLCIIVLNCFLVINTYHKTQQEGFDFNDMNPAKWVEKILGKIIDAILGSIPIIKDIAKKVKKEKGLFSKITTLFFELFMSLMTIIFLPLSALFVLYLSYQLFLVMMSNLPMLFKPMSFLKFIC
tara:strand:- start:1462 stop:1860 length:399 start_codon:yes stop_codon:yes gene_type:complete